MQEIYDDEEGLRIESKIETLDGGTCVAIFRIVGSIDTHTCSIHMLDNVITNKVNEPNIKTAIFNFSLLEHINSTGIGYMIRLGDMCRKEKSTNIAITNASAEHVALFDMLGLWELFKKFETEDDAMNDLKS